MKRTFLNLIVLSFISIVCLSSAAIGVTVLADVVDEVTEAADTTEKKSLLPHEFPELLLTYLAKEKGEAEPVNPEEIAFLTVSVNHCEYGEPAQIFSDEKTLGQFREALKGVTVTGKEDEIFSTETSICYSATDQDGNRVLFFPFRTGFWRPPTGGTRSRGWRRLWKLMA